MPKRNRKGEPSTKPDNCASQINAHDYERHVFLTLASAPAGPSASGLPVGLASRSCWSIDGFSFSKASISALCGVGDRGKPPEMGAAVLSAEVPPAVVRAAERRVETNDGGGIAAEHGWRSPRRRRVAHNNVYLQRQPAVAVVERAGGRSCK